MTRFKQLERYERALAGDDPEEISWAIEFSKSMLRRMKLKSGVDEWRKRRELAEARYEAVRQRHVT